MSYILQFYFSLTEPLFEFSVVIVIITNIYFIMLIFTK